MNRVRKEELGNGVWVYTAPFCPVMTDSLLLASFSAGCAAVFRKKENMRGGFGNRLWNTSLFME